MFVYIYILYREEERKRYICPGVQRTQYPPPLHRWYGSKDGLPRRVEYACHACHACICMNSWTCMSTSTYARIAYACRYMRDWHAYTYVFMHGIGMYAYIHASSQLHFHPASHRAEGALLGLGPFRGEAHGHLQGLPHIPQGGSPSPYHHHPGEEPLYPGTCIYV